jgi:hypothetical protein
MLAKYYRSIFIAKIAIGVIASIWFLWYYSTIQVDTTPAIIFVVDMQESMAKQDVADGIWLIYTRQQAAVQHIYHVVQSIHTGMDIGIIRLGYYPDYIVPLTRDRAVIDAYITSLASAPLSPVLLYQTGDVSLKDYYTIAPTAKYILLTDKQSTIDTVQNYIPTIDSILIDPTNSRADIQQRDDTVQTVSYRQWWYLWWIFVLITIVWLVLL